MPAPRAFRLLAVAVLLTSAGCSRQASTATGDANGSAAASTASTASDDAASAPANFDCAKVFGTADTTGLMAAPVTISAVSMSPGMCELKSSDGSTIQVSVDGDRDRALWDDPKQRALGKYQPVTGLGDEAFAVTSDDGTQLYVKKGSHHCGIVAGLETLPAKGDALARQVGKLCDKALAAL